MSITELNIDFSRIPIEKARFLNGHQPNLQIIRDFILDSWERSRIFSIPQTPDLNAESAIEGEIRRRLQSLKPFIDLFHEYEHLILSLIRDKNIHYGIFWADIEGTIVHVGGEPTFIQPGMRLSERDTGTNIVGTCILLNRSMLMHQKEFYQTRFNDSIYGSFPLISGEKSIAGCVGIELLTNTVEKEIFLIMEILVGIVNKQIVQFNKLNNFLTQNNELKGILENVPSGIIILNPEERITFISKKAREFLKIQDTLSRRPFFHSVIQKGISPSDLLRLEKEFTYREHLLTLGGQTKTFYISSSILRDNEGRVSGLLLAFSPFDTILKQVSHQAKPLNELISFRETMKNTRSSAKFLEQKITLARSPWDILVKGEKGLFQEDVARAIHFISERSTGPFIHFDLDQHTPFEIREELWGSYGQNHVQDSMKTIINQSNMGTLVLWHFEIMDEALQKEFYDILKKRELPDHRKINVRFICIVDPTSPKYFLIRELNEYFTDRILFIKPLRDYTGEMGTITKNLLQQLSIRYHINPPFVSVDVEKIFNLYAWPGNLNELQDILSTILLTHKPESIERKHLPEKLINLYPKTKYKDYLAEKRIKEIENALNEHKGNCRKAARQLGISRSTFYEWLGKYNIPQGKYRGSAEL